ncbi:MAG: VanZ family protein [Sneathiella sp.]
MRRILEIKWLFWMAWLSLALLICIGSLLPIQNIPLSTNLMSDKMMHTVAYLILGVCALLSVRTWRKQLRLILISFFMGVSIEIIQPLTGRYFEMYDILANSVGLGFAVCAYFGGAFLIKRIQSEKTVS